MSKQLLKNCTDEQVKSLLENYLKKVKIDPQSQAKFQNKGQTFFQS